jgi:D-arabinose 1-dehydrogenase-like Zn-dependent alcohol dehydrogenase
MGHEYVGVVEEVGEQVSGVKPRQFVIGSFFASDNTCQICRVGYHNHGRRSALSAMMIDQRRK